MDGAGSEDPTFCFPHSVPRVRVPEAVDKRAQHGDGDGIHQVASMWHLVVAQMVKEKSWVMHLAEEVTRFSTNKFLRLWGMMVEEWQISSRDKRLRKRYMGGWIQINTVTPRFLRRVTT